MSTMYDTSCIHKGYQWLLHWKLIFLQNQSAEPARKAIADVVNEYGSSLWKLRGMEYIKITSALAVCGAMPLLQMPQPLLSREFFISVLNQDSAPLLQQIESEAKSIDTAHNCWRWSVVWTEVKMCFLSKSDRLAEVRIALFFPSTLKGLALGLEFRAASKWEFVD